MTAGYNARSEYNETRITERERESERQTDRHRKLVGALSPINHKGLH